VILADSREGIRSFRSLWLKPNEIECRRAIQDAANRDLPSCVQELAKRAGRPVFCSRGEQGILVVDTRPAPPRIIEVPAYPVSGPIDVVGAGDSTNAAIVCAVAAGADLDQAASFGCLVASITIQQIGTTGTATPQQVRRRWQEVAVVS
jgi:sugar/nucleoside kinase (ribokinase family)